MYWGISYKFRSVSRYIKYCALAPSLFVAVSEVKFSRQTTLGRFGFKKSISHRNTVMETKVPNFVKLKTYNCIVFTDFQHTKLYPFQNPRFGFILKIFLKFRKFQPRHSYKIYSYKKKECSQVLIKETYLA